MRSIRPSLAATAIAAALALTATACQSGEDNGRRQAKPLPRTAADEDGAAFPQDLADKLKEHGLDLDKWKNGEWKNWDQDQWLREAEDFVNPYRGPLEAGPDGRGRGHRRRRVATRTSSGRRRASPTRSRAPVKAQAREDARTTTTPPRSGKVFFDTPEGPMVCSGTVVKDPRNPGKSNLVATAGHCVHAGKSGGWFRNIIFVPPYNNQGMSAGRSCRTPSRRRSPRTAMWWGDWASDLATTGSARAARVGRRRRPVRLRRAAREAGAAARQVPGGDGRQRR